MSILNLENSISNPKCFPSRNPICIDLILTNQKYLFKNSNDLEVGISNDDNFISTALRSQLVKTKYENEKVPRL